MSEWLKHIEDRLNASVTDVTLPLADVVGELISYIGTMELRLWALEEADDAAAADYADDAGDMDDADMDDADDNGIPF